MSAHKWATHITTVLCSTVPVVVLYIEVRYNGILFHLLLEVMCYRELVL